MFGIEVNDRARVIVGDQAVSRSKLPRRATDDVRIMLVRAKRTAVITECTRPVARFSLSVCLFVRLGMEILGWVEEVRRGEVRFREKEDLPKQATLAPKAATNQVGSTRAYSLWHHHSE